MAVQNPPPGTQRVIPYLMYDDAPAALEFLCRAFGFEERMRMPGPDGRLMHAEIGFQDNIVMLASTSEAMGTASPGTLPARHALVTCYVDDVDGHHARASAAGAKIVAELEDKFYGDRMYGVEDSEGHLWYFTTHVRDVAMEEMTKSPPAG